MAKINEMTMSEIVDRAVELGFPTKKSKGTITIENSFATGDVTATSDRSGGLVGSLNNHGGIITIENSYATGNVTGTNCVGGFIGRTYEYSTNSHNIISNSYATGNVTASGNSAGGFIGYVEDEWGKTTVENSYATGNVTGASYVGGFVGGSYSDRGREIFTISNSYSTGNVEASGN